MTIAYISIGSNLGSPCKQLNSAVEALKSIPNSLVIAVSSYFLTSPLGLKSQPDYMNAAVALDTRLSPEVLLKNTQSIEVQQGRVRKKERWGPRTLDLDIMLFGEESIKTDYLIIPHYDMKNRAFMLWPLFEIAPHVRFPDGESLKELIIRLDLKSPSKLGSLSFKCS